MRKALPLISVLAFALASAHAYGEDGNEKSGRYTLSPVEGGALRLDKETGSMALCRRREDKWLCEPVEDKAIAADERIRKLETENKDLKAHIDNLESMLSKEPKSDVAPPVGSMPVPSEEDVDKALDYVERMFKKFRDRLKKFEQEKPGPEPDAPSGNDGHL